MIAADFVCPRPDGNVWGKIVCVSEGKITPICCTHGGSMWLCPACGEAAIRGGHAVLLETALADGAENTIPSWFAPPPPRGIARLVARFKEAFR